MINKLFSVAIIVLVGLSVGCGKLNPSSPSPTATTHEIAVAPSSNLSPDSSAEDAKSYIFGGGFPCGLKVHGGQYGIASSCSGNPGTACYYGENGGAATYVAKFVHLGGSGEALLCQASSPSVSAIRAENPLGDAANFIGNGSISGTLEVGKIIIGKDKLDPAEEIAQLKKEVADLKAIVYAKNSALAAK